MVVEMRQKTKPVEKFEGREKSKNIRSSNVLAAIGVSECIKKSLGPKGLDKMIVDEDKNVIITNDGATILNKINVLHPIARMLIELSKSQDSKAGDGTTSVVIIAGSLLEKSDKLLKLGIHPTKIIEILSLISKKISSTLLEYAMPISSNEEVLKAIKTSLNSKVVSSHSQILAPIALKAVNMIKNEFNYADLKNIKVICKIGDSIEETKLINGLLFDSKVNHNANGPSTIKNAKIGLIQFQLSSPKTDMDNSVTVRQNEDIDRVYREERKHIANLIKPIAKSGCNVLLIQKSILRDAVNMISLNFLAKKKIMVVTDVERSDIEFICKSLGCKPIANIDSFQIEKLGYAELAKEVSTAGGKIIKITGIKNPGKACSILVRGTNNLILEETERSLHDAICVARCLVQSPYILPGGGAAELKIAKSLLTYSKEFGGVDNHCIRNFAESCDVIPFILAENCGLHAMDIIMKIKEEQNNGNKFAGINVKHGCVSKNMMNDDIVSPLLVTKGAFELAIECVQMILKIDDIVSTHRML